jgi:hypothetical protein
MLFLFQRCSLNPSAIYFLYLSLHCESHRGMRGMKVQQPIITIFGRGVFAQLVWTQPQPRKGQCKTGEVSWWPWSIRSVVPLRILGQSCQVRSSLSIRFQLICSHLFSMSNQFSDAHTKLIMPENWDSYKDIIKELYIKRGYTLEELRRIMSIEHGVDASWEL